MRVFGFSERNSARVLPEGEQNPLESNRLLVIVERNASGSVFIL